MALSVSTDLVVRLIWGQPVPRKWLADLIRQHPTMGAEVVDQLAFSRHIEPSFDFIGFAAVQGRTGESIALDRRKEFPITMSGAKAKDHWKLKAKQLPQRFTGLTILEQQEVQDVVKALWDKTLDVTWTMWPLVEEP